MCDGDHQHDNRWLNLYRWNTIFTAVGALGGWLAIGIMAAVLILQ